MTTTPHRQKKRFPRWVFVLVVLVVVGAAVAGISALFASNRAATQAPPPPPPSSSVAMPGADGCIAGRDNDAKSLIAGAREQPQSEAGAVATAAGIMRFLMQYPWPNEQELITTFSELSMAEDVQDAEEAAEGFLSSAGPETARTAGSSFADARYIVEPGSAPAQIRISVAAQAVTDGTLNGSAVAMTFTMNWDDEVWKVEDLGEGSAESEILSNGAAFVGGC